MKVIVRLIVCVESLLVVVVAVFLALPKDLKRATREIKWRASRRKVSPRFR